MLLATWTEAGKLAATEEVGPRAFVAVSLASCLRRERDGENDDAGVSCLFCLLVGFIMIAVPASFFPALVVVIACWLFLLILLPPSLFAEDDN